MDSGNASLCARLRRFIFGYEIRMRGRIYRYPGLLERDEVKDLGQSVVFVTLAVLPSVEAFLSSNCIEYVITVAGIGPIMPNRAERRALAMEAIESMTVTNRAEV